MFEFYQIIMRCVINFPNFVAAWNHMVCDIYCEILANLLKFYTQYHNIADALFTSGIELSTESRETKMAVDRWGKDCDTANVALRGLVTDAKAAFAALWGERVKLQKASVRVISHSSYLAHSDPLFSSLKIIKIYDLTHLALLTFKYRAVNNLLPKKFSSFLKQLTKWLTVRMILKTPLTM